MSIATKAMVLNLGIGMWSGHRLDREATRRVTEEANAVADAARVNKHLVPKEALKEVVTAAGAIRTHFYDKTLPWKDNGDRLLTRVMFPSFIDEHERLVGQFNDAVQEFLSYKYPSVVSQAEFRMGDMFDPNDYPTPSSLRHKFYARMEIDAVTEAGDFRVEMDASEADAIRANMEKAMADRLNTAMRDVWERMAEVVGRFAERMATKDAVFKEATVQNITELVEVLPGLNVLNDPDIERIRQDIERSLTGYTAKELRKEPATRAEAATEAQRIMDQMKGFMAAMQGAQ